MTGTRFEGPEMTTNGLEMRGVLVRGGCIVPTWERERRSTQPMQNDPVTLHVYISDGGEATGFVSFRIKRNVVTTKVSVDIGQRVITGTTFTVSLDSKDIIDGNQLYSQDSK